jgi:uncharacterized SAM-binding protein YcdF (DUF218 family)
MYSVKQLISALVSPVLAVFLIVTASLIFMAFRRRVISRYLLVCAALVGYLGSIPLVAEMLVGPLERQYPPLRQDQPLPAVGYIVVLGSGYTPHDGIPITAALDADGLARVVEGVRLARLRGPVRLVLSGGAPVGHLPPAIGYAELARGLGMSDTSLVVLSQSLDTSEEAQTVARLLGRAPFILVTSAYHMPRAMRLMRRAGTSPIPAPTGQRAGVPNHPWYGLLPSSGGLETTQRALHEYLGLAALAAHLER